MDAARWDRLAPLSGIVFVVLTVVGFVVGQSNSPDDFPGEVGEIVEYYVDDPGKILIGSWIGIVGTFFLIWFVGAVYSRLRAAEGREGRVAAVALGGGLAAAAISLAVDAVNAAAAFRADEDDRIDPGQAAAMYDLQGALVGIALPVGIAALTGAIAVLALRVGVLPRWFGVASAVLAIGLLIAPIAWFLVLVSMLWIVALSILLYVRTPVEPAAATPPAGTA
jgi:hypothetical protein